MLAFHFAILPLLLLVVAAPVSIQAVQPPALPAIHGSYTFLYFLNFYTRIVFPLLPWMSCLYHAASCRPSDHLRCKRLQAQTGKERKEDVLKSSHN